MLNICRKSCRKVYHFSCGALCTAPGEHYFIFLNNMDSWCWAHAPRQTRPSNLVADPLCMVCLEQVVVGWFEAWQGWLSAREVNSKQDLAFIHKNCLPSNLLNIFGRRRSVVVFYDVSSDIVEQDPPPGPGPGRLVSPCCGRTFHRDCVQKTALQAGKAALKCPACNDKETFNEEMELRGIYVPHADAQWEMPENSNFYRSEQSGSIAF